MSSEFDLDIEKERENIVFIARQIEKFARLIAVMTELGAEYVGDIPPDILDEIFNG